MLKKTKALLFMLAAVAVLLPCGRLQAQNATADTSKAKTTGVRTIGTVTVSGRIDDLIGVAASASQGRVGHADLRVRPITREGELLETVPGVIVTQHSGEGKANQYFVRGFNLDHGTDFQTRVDGMPVNLPSHAHGQGWTDLNFLIPEFVEHLDYSLGVYDAEVGDFGSAGSAEFHLFRKLDRPFANVGFGDNGLLRFAGGGSAVVRGGDLLTGVELKGYDGPWQLAEKVRKVSALSRYSKNAGNNHFSFLGLAYRNAWNSNDQIPDRAVARGLIDRFGQIDGTDGGKSERYSASGSWVHVGSNAVDKINLFGIYSDLTLYSNFTFFLEDSVRGDQFSQHDRRWITGGNASREKQIQFAGVTHDFKSGLQFRGDFISPAGLYRTQQRSRTSMVREDSIQELSTGLHFSATSLWSKRFRTVLGQRFDFYDFKVRSSLPENSGHTHAFIASPKGSLIFNPTPGSELYVSGGLGFHSNDARGTTITIDPSTREAAQRVDPLVRSRGAEIGVRITPVAGLRSTLAVWGLSLNSELVFTGDGGTTEASAASQRSGITWANFYRPKDALSFDADFSLARARFSGVPSNENRIPGALENVIAAGAAFNPSLGIFGSLRLRHFGAYPLKEDNSVRATSTTLVNGDVGYTVRSGIRMQATVLNILNSPAFDIQYGYVSRLRGEQPAGVDDIHFHPIEPRQVRFSLELGF